VALDEARVQVEVEEGGVRSKVLQERQVGGQASHLARAAQHEREHVVRRAHTSYMC
jgi:hypothetical protein